MNQLKYCPKCGQKTLIWNHINRWNCDQCSYVYYHNCAAAVAVIIRYNDEIYLTQRNQEPQKGFWDLAGGFVDPKESAETTCERELYEELKLKINPIQLKILGTQPNIYHFKDIDYNTLDLFYEYEVEEKSNFNLELAEISNGEWFNIKDIPIDKIAFESQRRFLQYYQKKGT